MKVNWVLVGVSLSYIASHLKRLKMNSYNALREYYLSEA